MHISQYGALLGLFGLAVEASPASLPVVDNREVEVRSSSNALNYPLVRSWENLVLYSG